MANEFDTAELIDIRRFTGYGQPIADYPLSTNAAALEARLAAMDDEQAEVVRSSYLAPLRLQHTAYVNSYATMANAVIGKGAIERNPAELTERAQLLGALGRALAAFIGVPVGPLLSSPSAIGSGRVVR